MSACRTALIGVALALRAVRGHGDQGEIPPQPDPRPAVRAFATVVDPVTLLRGATLIDGTGAAPKLDQVIVIRDGRIAAVGPRGSVPTPPGARILDLAGKSVIPGIIGMHDHIHYAAFGWPTLTLGESSPKLYLGAGVTTIRVAGSAAPYEDLALKRLIDGGVVPGPRMFLSGPYLSGPGAPLRSMVQVRDTAHARQLVRYWRSEGATWFKVHATIDPIILGAIVTEAHALGAKVIGHFCSVGFTEAVRLGVDGLEHGLFGNTEYDPAKRPGRCPPFDPTYLERVEIGSSQVQATFEALRTAGAHITSTLPVLESLVPTRIAALESRVTEFMHPALREPWLAAMTGFRATPGQGLSERALRNAMAYERAFVAAGGTLVAGVDNSGSGAALAGLGDQRGLELLIEAGFDLPAAIQIMTLNGARVLGVERDFGSIEAGKVADLVVIGGDLVARPAEIRQVELVFKDGVGYESRHLLAAAKGLVGFR